MSEPREIPPGAEPSPWVAKAIKRFNGDRETFTRPDRAAAQVFAILAVADELRLLRAALEQEGKE